jgi:hypothetical protein
MPLLGTEPACLRPSVSGAICLCLLGTPHRERDPKSRYSLVEEMVIGTEDNSFLPPTRLSARSRRTEQCETFSPNIRLPVIKNEGGGGRISQRGLEPASLPAFLVHQDKPWIHVVKNIGLWGCQKIFPKGGKHFSKAVLDTKKMLLTT